MRNESVRKNMNTPEPDRKKPWWQLGMTAWCMVVMLVVLNMAVISGMVPTDKHSIAWFVYSLDPRFWPIWIVWFLWGITALKAIHWWYGPEFQQKIILFLILALLLVFIGYIGQELMRTNPVRVRQNGLSKLYNDFVLISIIFNSKREASPRKMFGDLQPMAWKR